MCAMLYTSCAIMTLLDPMTFFNPCYVIVMSAIVQESRASTCWLHYVICVPKWRWHILQWRWHISESAFSIQPQIPWEATAIHTVIIITPHCWWRSFASGTRELPPRIWSPWCWSGPRGGSRQWWRCSSFERTTRQSKRELYYSCSLLDVVLKMDAALLARAVSQRQDMAFQDSLIVFTRRCTQLQTKPKRPTQCRNLKHTF